MLEPLLFRRMSRPPRDTRQGSEGVTGMSGGVNNQAELETHASDRTATAGEAFSCTLPTVADPDATAWPVRRVPMEARTCRSG